MGFFFKAISKKLKCVLLRHRKVGKGDELAILFYSCCTQETDVKVKTFSFITSTVGLKHIVVAAALIDSASAFPIKP